MKKIIEQINNFFIPIEHLVPRPRPRPRHQARSGDQGALRRRERRVHHPGPGRPRQKVSGVQAARLRLCQVEVRFLKG